MAELTPLTTWTCDACREQILPAEGLVIATDGGDEQRPLSDFQIVHKSINGRRCDPRDGDSVSYELSAMIGPTGLARLLSLLSAGPIQGTPGAVLVDDLDAYVDLVRRLQSPYYEQARSNFQAQEVTEEFGGANEIGPYVPESLKWIAGVSHP